MDRIRFVTHREQRVLLLDFTGCTAEEVAELVDRVPEVVTREPRGSVLVVADFTGAEFSRDAVERMKIATALDRPHVKCSVWVGVDNLPKTLFDSIRTFSAREFPIYTDRSEALDYVTGA